MSDKQVSFWNTTPGLAAMVMIGAVSYFLFMEHRQHLFQALPLLIFLLCPIMHLFMHHGHGHDHSNKEQGNTQDDYQRGYEDGRKETQSKNQL